MRIVIQRVLNASVTIDCKLYSAINQGLMILVGVTEGDTEQDMEWLAAKAANMRIFDDENGVMNLSVKDIEGEILVVSQFTLYASTVKGNRPSYIKAAKPEIAIPLYEKFVSLTECYLGKEVKRGVFGADMKVSLLNDGPVTIIVDSKLKF